MEKDTKDITISSIIIQQGNLNSIAWREEQEKDEELQTVKQWIDNGTAPTRDELKSKSMKLQRLGKLFESFVIEPRSNALAIKTAEFEHPEIDKYRIIVPDHLEQDVFRRFHKSSRNVRQKRFVRFFIANFHAPFTCIINGLIILMREYHSRNSVLVVVR